MQSNILNGQGQSLIKWSVFITLEHTQVGNESLEMLSSNPNSSGFPFHLSHHECHSSYNNIFKTLEVREA